MKKIYTIVILLSALRLAAQPYNNEWIDYSKTYYKFKVGATGLYRIPQSVLAAAGMGAVPVQNFQLFRNGQEVPVYTSVSSGVLGASDFIEFWGVMNDGAPDAPLYRSPSYQHTTHWSLETDTAVYFLTVNPTGSTFHFSDVANNVAGSPLTPEPFFMYSTGSYFKNGGVNPGFAQVVGEYIYSSSYDIGEFWASPAIPPGTPLTDTRNNLFVYPGGPNASIKFGMVGAADNARTVQLTVNGSVVEDTTMNSFYDVQATKPVPLSLISGNTATINYINNSTVTTDRMVASFYELSYPRQFNFGGQDNFAFQLPARTAGYLLNIANFGIVAGATPVLYDLTNGLRYTGVVSGTTVSFALNGSTATYNLVLVNEDPSTVHAVSTLTQKTFQNFANSSVQGNYLIITNPLLYNDGTNDGINPVNDYKTYRSSPAGGSWDVQIYDINELVDQFGFGIKKHPDAVQNFIRWARAKFTVKPQFIFIIGHGMCYNDYNAASEVNHDPNADLLDLVPTFGYPASDNKLSANDGAGATPLTPIGRLSVVSGAEIETYLTKVKEYENLQVSAPNTIDGRLWMKNGVHLTGVSEPYLGTILCNYMNYYGSLISDTLMGATISTFCDGNATAVTQIPSTLLADLFSTGITELCYFGHSANDVLAYNLNEPTDYNNTGGKYPVFYINGCDAGDFFVYDVSRLTSSKTLSEDWLLSKERGAIAFVASTHLGIVNYLNIMLSGLFQDMTTIDYGKPIGIIEKDALNYLTTAAPGDFFARLHAEEMTMHGDPVLKLNQGPTDYDIEASQVVINPSFVSISNSTFEVKARFYNLGKAVSDSVGVLVTRTYPNGNIITLLSKKIRGIRYSDSIDISVPIVGIRDKGDNKITVTIDPGNVIPEATYANNTVTTDVFIYQDEANPVYPYNYAIINTPTSKLYASTANPLAPSEQYVMDIDTTQNFNSPLKVEKVVTSVGGVLEFDPGISYMDSVVYYWRVGTVPTGGGAPTYNFSSFTYIDPAHSGVGYNQSHYFQHLGSTGTNLRIMPTRLWAFDSINHDIYQRNAVFPIAG
ncbi:MAG TPA: C25 family cysteine peptidase, partial [Puia sp.]|nr:C25 family cysteine peptidase [Puia sp.]